MEILDNNTITVLLAILVVILSIIAYDHGQQLTKTEQLLEQEREQTKQYSNESLDRFEQISKLRMELVDLKRTLEETKVKLLEANEALKLSKETAKSKEAEPVLQAKVETVVEPAKGFMVTKREKSPRKKK
jgi:hypothetical protein